IWLGRWGRGGRDVGRHVHLEHEPDRADADDIVGAERLRRRDARDLELPLQERAVRAVQNLDDVRVPHVADARVLVADQRVVREGQVVVGIPADGEGLSQGTYRAALRGGMAKTGHDHTSWAWARAPTSFPAARAPRENRNMFLPMTSISPSLMDKRKCAAGLVPAATSTPCRLCGPTAGELPPLLKGA